MPLFSVQTAVSNTSGNKRVIYDFTNQETPYQKAATQQINALLKCPLVSGEFLDTVKQASCYPVVYNDADYVQRVGQLQRFLKPGGLTSADASGLAVEHFNFFMHLITWNSATSGNSVADYDDYYKSAIEQVCACYSGPSYTCCQQSINCQYFGVQAMMQGLYDRLGLGDPGGIPVAGSLNNPFYVINSSTSNTTNISEYNIGTLMTTAVQGFFPELDLSAIKWNNGEFNADKIQKDTKVADELIKYVVAFFDNEFMVDNNGVPRWHLPLKPLNVAERINLGKLHGKLTDYSVLANSAKTCWQNAWCNPNTGFLDFNGCVYPLEISEISGKTERPRTVNDVSNTNLPNFVTAKSVLERFDYCTPAVMAAGAAETYCYWVETGNTDENNRPTYKFSNTRPDNTNPTMVGITGKKMAITGPGTLQDQLTPNLTRLPSPYTDWLQAACCLGKEFIDATRSPIARANIESVCGITDQYLKFETLDITVTKDNIEVPTTMPNTYLSGTMYFLLGCVFSPFANFFASQLGGVNSAVVTEIEKWYKLMHTGQGVGDVIHYIQGKNAKQVIKDSQIFAYSKAKQLDQGTSHNTVGTIPAFNNATKTVIEI